MQVEIGGFQASHRLLDKSKELISFLYCKNLAVNATISPNLSLWICDAKPADEISCRVPMCCSLSFTRPLIIENT